MDEPRETVCRSSNRPHELEERPDVHTGEKEEELRRLKTEIHRRGRRKTQNGMQHHEHERIKLR